jgi:hypothetical protein
MMDAIDLGLGAILLILGRKFFWLFVGILGFIAGLGLAERVLVGRPQWVILLVALVAGFIGAGVAIFLQRLAIALAGFLAGGYILIHALTLLGIDSGNLYWILFVVGGIIGAILVTLLFDWALIVLSSITGANLIIEALRLTLPNRIWLFLLLALVGIIIQAVLMQRDRQTAPA